MKIFTTTKTGYAYSRTCGWRGDYYKVIATDGETTYSYNLLVGYEGPYPIIKYLKDKGYKQLFTGFDVYGQVKKKDYKGYKFDTLDDIKRDIK